MKGCLASGTDFTGFANCTLKRYVCEEDTCNGSTYQTLSTSFRYYYVYACNISLVHLACLHAYGIKSES